MKKAIIGEGLVTLLSIPVLALILIVVFYFWVPSLSYANIKGIEQIISSKKVANDGGISLINLLNSPIENINLYEFILLNKNEKEKLREKISELMKDICYVDEKTLLDKREDVCLWYLEIKFTDQSIILIGGYNPITYSLDTSIFAKSDKNTLSVEDFKVFRDRSDYSLTLPDYNNNFVIINLYLFKGLILI